MNSITKKQAQVDANLAANEQEHEIITSNDEFILAHTRTFSRGWDAKELKDRISIVSLLRADGYKVNKSGRYSKCLCPFHKERTPSFSTYDEKFAKCYGECGWKGDIFDYVMKRDDCDFITAKRALETFLQTNEGKKRKCAPPSVTERSARSPMLTVTQRAQVADAASRIPNNLELASWIADTRGWKAETIIQLGRDGHLGWYRGALGFIYNTGLKLRAWPHREFAWEFGHQSVWRGELIAPGKQVFVTEGETDAISLIDSGIEKDAGRVVVAIPGASSFQEHWGEMFTGTDVVLCMDNDAAGERATEDVGGMVGPYANSLSSFNFEEVCK